MSSGKKILSIFFLLLLLAAIPVTTYLVFRQQELRSRATPATTLAFDPPSIDKTVGDTFTINVTINTGTNSVTGAELHIQYDTSKLKAVNIRAADNAFLPITLVDGTVGNGLALITLGSQPTLPKTGTGVLATVTFQALAPTAGAKTLISFTGETRVAGLTGGTIEASNVLATQPAPASVGISAQTTPTPTPSSTPTPSAARSPTPSPTRGAGGGATPTPTKVGGNIGIGSSKPTGTPTIIAKATPTTAKIPVTGATDATTILTVGGVVLFGLGVALFFVF